jgi:transcriptional regulator with XRE-family HTH domain
VSTPTNDQLAASLGQVGQRLKALRRTRRLTLEQVAEITGASMSTLSRLESGQRRPTLELLLPIAAAYRVPLDELVGAPPTGDPRIHPKPLRRNGTTWLPLQRVPGGVNAFKQILPVDSAADIDVQLQTHEGSEWIYVLSGRLRLYLGAERFDLAEGDAAEFDTRTPHAMRNVADHATELLVLFGQQGQRVHMRSAKGPGARASTS